MKNVPVKAEDFKKLVRDVAQIKELLLKEREEREMEEIELTEWASRELREARSRPEKEYISLENVKKRILSKQ